MPYQIGRAFSDDVFGVIEGSRNRAANARPPSISRRSTYDTGLEAAYLRAQDEEKDRELRRELGMAEQGYRDRALDAGLEETRIREGGSMERAGLENDRRLAADSALAGHREGLLGVREQEATARAGRYDSRSQYERGVLDVRQREAGAEEARAASAAETADLRKQMDGARSRKDALDLILRIKQEATKPDGRDAAGRPLVTPEKRAQYAALLREAGGLLAYSPEAGGRGMGKDVSDSASAAMREILGADADGFDEELDALDDETGYQDWGG